MNIYQLKKFSIGSHDSSNTNGVYQRVMLFRIGCDDSKNLHYKKLWDFDKVQSIPLDLKMCDLMMHMNLYQNSTIPKSHLNVYK